MSKSTKLAKRSERYISRLAESKGLEYSLSPTRANAGLLVSLYEMCDNYEGREDSMDVSLLKELCSTILEASLVPVMQGWPQPEPSEDKYEYYERVFRLINPYLNMCDVKYQNLKRSEVPIEFRVTADDDDVLRLKPNTQLHFKFEK